MIQMSKNQYSTLLYWANVGYSAKGKEYEAKFPKRKSPWYKINRNVLICTVGEKLSDYITQLQKKHDKLLIKGKDGISESDIASIRSCVDLINILIGGYDVLRGRTHE